MIKQKQTKKTSTIKVGKSNPIKKSNAGAKCKLKKYENQIIESLRNGSTITDAIAGLIHDSTYYDWYNHGKRDLLEGIESEFSEFSRKVDKAEKDYRDSLRKEIKKHAMDDWRSAAYLLERSDPKNYNLKTKMDVVQSIELSQKAILELPDNGRRTLQ